MYPPPANTTISWVTINMDLAPEDRWTEVTKPLAAQIETLIDNVIDLLPEKFRNELIPYVNAHAATICNDFPQPYGQEIVGISKATGIDLGRLVLMNVAYELEGVCTSIVAQDAQGNLFHARNLDFGLFLGWDQTNKTWKVAEALRPLLFNAHFVRNGTELYKSVAYAGFVGLLTGMKTGAFSISVDTRFDNNLDKGLWNWFKGDHSGHFLTFTTRNAIENAANYDEAFTILNSTKLLGPGYIILGGVSAGQGVILTREEEKSIKPLLLTERITNGSFYLLETNYDWWVQPPFFDDRRYPAQDCLTNHVHSAGVGFESLFNVLSAHPNLNRMTTYSALMQVATGRMESYIQDCPLPCPLW